jgi:hypothetical protein
MTLKQEAAERMASASRREIQEDKLWDWLNNPTMQSRGKTTKSGIEKELER